MEPRYKIVAPDEAWEMYFKHERYWLYRSREEAERKAMEYGKQWPNNSYSVLEADSAERRFADRVESTILQLLERRYQRDRYSFCVTEEQEMVNRLMAIFRDDV